MAQYTIRFKDHGGNVYSVHEASHPDDDTAIAGAHKMDVPGIGNGFQLWEGERLVHVHPVPHTPQIE
jgi:hypothetical protein